MTDFNSNQFNKPAPVRPTRPGSFPAQKQTPSTVTSHVGPKPTPEPTTNHPADDFLNPDRYHEPINPAGFPAAAQISHKPQAPQHLPLNPTAGYNNPEQPQNYTPNTYSTPTSLPNQPWNTQEKTDNPTQTGWNKESIIAITFAVLGMVLIWFDIRAGLGLIAGIVLGHRSLKQNRTTGQKGKPLSIAALIIGYTATAITLAILGIGLIITALEIL